MLQVMKILKNLSYFNPFTLKISKVILPTVSHTILMMSVGRIWYQIK